MEKHHLLNLPLEIIQLIMWHMDPATFYISLVTYKKLLTAALDSRRNIIRHLGSLPGLRLGMDQLTTRELFVLFRARAGQSLCAAGVLANVKLYIPTYNPLEPALLMSQVVRKMSRVRKMNNQIAKNLVGGGAHNRMSKAVFSLDPVSSPHLLARVDENEVVNIYVLADEGVSLIAQLWHSLPDALETSNLVVMKMAFSPNRDLAVLYKLRDSLEGKDQEPSPLSETPQPAETLKLVTFSCSYVAEQGLTYSSALQETRDINTVTADPTGLAIAPNGNACVSFKRFSQAQTELWFIDRNTIKMEKNGYDPDPKIHVFESDFGNPDTCTRGIRLISRMEYIEKGMALNFFDLDYPVHKWYTKTDPERCITDIVLNSFEVMIVPDIVPERFVIGVPFWGHHLGDIYARFSPNVQQKTTCVSCFLAVGMSRTAGHNNVYIVGGIREVPDQEDQRDYEVDLHTGIKCMHWTALAFLAGWGQGKSSLGTITATSPKGSCIAAANWDCVQVWTFNPLQLHETSGDASQSYFPTRDYNSKRKIGRLRPMKLSKKGVIYGMLWTSERVLFAVTEHGLVQWDMRFTSTGLKEELSLDSGICQGLASAQSNKIASAQNAMTWF